MLSSFNRLSAEIPAKNPSMVENSMISSIFHLCTKSKI